jgi:hypothetical protein
MSRKDRRAAIRQAQGRPRAERLRTLLEAGDHAAARAEARAVLADAAASPEDRQAAAAALSSLSPEPGAVLAGALGVAAAAAIVIAVVLRG